MVREQKKMPVNGLSLFILTTIVRWPKGLNTLLEALPSDLTTIEQAQGASYPQTLCVSKRPPELDNL